MEIEIIKLQEIKTDKRLDKVNGTCHGGNMLNLEEGAFKEYLITKSDNQIKMPSHFSFAEGASVGAGINSVGQGLYQSLALPFPPVASPDPLLLIYGGSTATGSLAIQFAKLNGCTVVTTCSPHNFEYVSSLGADKIFDYNDPNCMAIIKEYTGNRLMQVLDCISEGNSTDICVGSMSDEGGIYATLGRVEEERVRLLNSKVIMKYTLAYTIYGEPFKLGDEYWEASKEDQEHNMKF